MNIETKSTAVSTTCPLCQGNTHPFHKQMYRACSVCKGIFRTPAFLPSPEEEKARYEEHHNDVDNPGYQSFVSPIVSRVLIDFEKSSQGLDFGSGTGPVISKLLTDQGFDVRQYDPFFADHPSLLGQQYDYIACCEVIEHFHQPAKEFKLLRQLLKPNGKLYCMTHVYSSSITFDNWYYMRDPTHSFIYQAETLEWIKKQFDFHRLEMDNRLVVLSV